MGERGPAAKPAQLHLLRGDPSKLGTRKLGAMLDDQVRPAVEIPPCPKHLSDEARKEWRRIAPHLEKLGLVSQIDRAALAAYCTAWGDYVWAERRMAELNGAVFDPDGKQVSSADKSGERGRIWDTPSGYKQISVPMQIRNRALEQMHKFLAEFGMSPASRSKVTAGDAQLALPGMAAPQEGGWGTFPEAPKSSA